MVAKPMTGRVKWIKFGFLCSPALSRMGGVVLNAGLLQIHAVALNLPLSSGGREEASNRCHLSPAFHSQGAERQPQNASDLLQVTRKHLERAQWKQRLFFQSPDTDETLMEYTIITYDFMLHPKFTDFLSNFHPSSMVRSRERCLTKANLWKQCAEENAGKHNYSSSTSWKIEGLAVRV